MTTKQQRIQNPDLEHVHRELVGLVARLDESVGDAPDAKAAQTILGQIAEINARVSALGRELFAARTDALAAASAAIADAIPEVEGAIADLERTQRFVAGVTRLLALVDDAVGTARMAAGA